jgi:hypothetical protein
VSRSFRKPIYTEGYKGKARKHSKRLASRAVRASDDIADGKAYRKQFNSWDICDWKIPAPNDWKARRK